MDIRCQFGPVTVLFQEFPDHPVWPFWRWKLDGFQKTGADPDITVSYSGQSIAPEGIPVWEEAGAQVCRQIYRQPDGGYVWQQTNQDSGMLQLQLAVSPDWRRIGVTCDETPTAGMAAFESLTFLIFYAFSVGKVLTLHAAVVEEGGRAFMICADSGVGKTTHARLWRDEKNALILNGDRATCYRRQGQWIAFGSPWCGTSGEYLNRCAPLQAVVILQRGMENRVTVGSGLALLPYVVYPQWDLKIADGMLTLLDELLKTIPVLQLECTPDADAVAVLYQALEKLP